MIERLFAKASVWLDGCRPLRGPLARPAWWAADVLTDISLWAYTRKGSLYERDTWPFSRLSHRRVPGWGYCHPLQRVDHEGEGGE